MRFASPLISLADEFRREHLSNTDDELDSISLPEDWRDEEATGIASKGGDYICGHLRRQDFLWGRAEEVPSMKAAASQLKNVAAKLGVRKIFIATDGTSKGKHSNYCFGFTLRTVSEHSDLIDWIQTFYLRNGGTAILVGASAPTVSVSTIRGYSPRNSRRRSGYSGTNHLFKKPIFYWILRINLLVSNPRRTRDYAFPSRINVQSLLC